MIRLDQELMKSFEELTYNFQEFIYILRINVKLKNRESFKNRFLKLFSILACYALYLNQESRKIPTCFRLVFLDS